MEACFVVVSGHGSLEVAGQRFDRLGSRDTPFDRVAPDSVYAPPGCSFGVTASDNLELAICRAPAEGKYPVRRIATNSMGFETLGKGSNVRHRCHILPETEPAERLLVVEVITPAGNWSSYPPHKHDVDDLPHESELVETYYHRMNPPQGFAFQRVYTADLSIDETMTVENGDAVMVPKGYHPVAAAHGYDLYYLNVMAGPRRTWKFRNDPSHDWLG